MHDENGNGKMDMGLFGPKEAYGASNNAEGTFGPRFKDAKFEFNKDGQVIKPIPK